MDVQVLVWWLPIPHTRLVILSLSFLFVFSRGRHGDVSETSYIAGAAFSANSGSQR
jgi:hypothetical protein